MPSIHLTSLNNAEFHIHDESVFHALGTPEYPIDHGAIYSEEEYMSEMRKYFKEEDNYNSLKNAMEDLYGEDKHSDKERYKYIIKHDKEIEDILYYRLANNEMRTSSKILVGDIVFITSSYESRQYYGLGVVVPDKDKDKKVAYYGDGGFDRNPIVKEVCKKLLEHDKNFFVKADKKAYKEIKEFNNNNNDGMSGAQDAAESAAGIGHEGGKRRGRSSTRKSNRKSRKHTRRSH